MNQCQKIAQLANLRSPLFWIIISCLLVASIGIADFLTGNELGFSLFYLIPIILVTWFLGRNFGIAFSIISAIAWYIAGDKNGQTYSQPFIGYWNAGIRLGFFTVVTLLLPALKALEREKRTACTDYLTGVANRRDFYEKAQTALNRSQSNKRPFTIAYISLDNFKIINEQFGQQIGDKLLCLVADRAKKHLGGRDLIARFCSDEFILLLSETDPDAAQVIVHLIQCSLLDEMRRNDWPVTFSIGVLTYVGSAITVDELIKKTEDLMNTVKQNGKNTIMYAAYSNKCSHLYPPQPVTEPLEQREAPYKSTILPRAPG